MIVPSSSPPRVQKYKGANGITILQQDNPGSRAFCMGVWVNTGSRDEKPGEEGLCHFLEHTVFKGTRNRSAFEISQAIEKVGGALEAFTTKEQICVYTQVLDEHKALAAEVLGDMILHSTYPAEQIALEKKVVLEEIRDVMDAPDDLIHELFAREIYPGHPLGRPILGRAETVSRFGRSKLLRFAAKQFRADNMVISVVGNIGKQPLMQLCDWAFRLPTGGGNRRTPRLRKYRPVRKHHRRKLHHQHICVGARSYSYLDERRYSLMVLTTLLGGSMSSRLFQRIREELGYTYSIYTYADPARDSGLLGTYFAVKPANVGKVIREVLREFDKIKAGEVGADELEVTKEQLKGRILLGLETSASKMMRVAQNEICFGRQISEQELIANITRVSMDDLIETASEVLDVGNTTIVSLGPSSAGLGAGA
ncbi:MAG: pitrilysin family protein [Candidatus Krumholzibacteria bacterium]